MTHAAEPPHVAVIGAGVAGATAARYLAHHGYRVTVLEATPRVGGRIRSTQVDGIPVEVGAQDLMSFYRRTLALVEDVGLRSRLRPVRHQLGILVEDRMVPLASRQALLGTALVPHRAKAQLLRLLVRTLRQWRTLDMNRVWANGHQDHLRVADLLPGPTGEALRRQLLAPFLDALVHCPPEHASALLLSVVLKAQLQASTMFTLDGGIDQLVTRMLEDLQVAHGCVVTALSTDPDGRVTVSIRGQADPLMVDGVVCAVPGPAVRGLLRDPSAAEAQFLDAVEYSSTATVTMAVTHRAPVPASLVLAPSGTSHLLSIAGIRSRCYPTYLPEDGDLVQFHTGPAAGSTVAALSDTRLVQRVVDDARALLPDLLPDGEPHATRVDRWTESLPVFRAGYLRELHRFQQHQDNLPPSRGGLVLAGDYLEAPFLEGAVTSGQRAAERLHRYLSPAATNTAPRHR